jgi:hypothetical protein
MSAPQHFALSCRQGFGTPPLRSVVGFHGWNWCAHRTAWAGATKVMISRVQALQRHARQEAAGALTQSPDGPNASGATIRHQAA